MRARWRAALSVVGLYAFAAGAIAWYGLSDTTAHADIIVVPGNTVSSDGTPSPRLQARLDTALALFNEGQAPIIFVSGAIGREGPNEATVMAAYLAAKGVPRAALVEDLNGSDTAATAMHAAAYLRARHLGRALVATQYFHVARTVLALQRRGVDVVGTRHAAFNEWRDIYSLPREAAGYAAYVWRL